MAPWLLRKDFVLITTPCAAGCGRTLKSGVAWIVTDGGTEGAYGPQCIKDVLGKEAFERSRHVVPNLTAHEVTEKGPGGKRGKGGGGGAVDEIAARHAKAAAYLTLRISGSGLATLRGIHPGVRYSALADLHAALVKNRGLTPEQVDHVHHIEAAAKAKADRWWLCLDNLLDVYTAYHRLLRLRRKATTDKQREWIDTMTVSLLKYLYLTPKQIEKLGLKLRATAFPPEHRPRYEAPKAATAP
jgi:hypothetical protein